VRSLVDAVFAHVTLRAGAPPPMQSMACEATVLSLVAHLRRHSTAGDRCGGAARPCIRRARAAVDHDPAARFTLAQLAGAVGVSRYQLIRGFAQEVGMTPHAYIVQQRLALARRMIRAGGDLGEVAVVAGFFDQSHLTRRFVRQFGVTPRRYATRVR
jgi:AraC-like DNA-binding protein